MGHVQTQEEWEAEMSEKILSYVRDELYLELRFRRPRQMERCSFIRRNR